MIPRSGPPLRSTKPIARKPIKKRKRSAADQREKFAREYGSEERRQFVADQPCVACGWHGHEGCENAHTKGDGGSRKGHYTTIVPLCPPHTRRRGLISGCHRALHNQGIATFQALWCVDLAAEAARIHSLWLAFSSPSP